MKLFRYPLRAAIMGIAAVCSVWGILSGAGLWAVFFGAILGGVAGEILARSKFALWALSAALFAGALFARGFSYWVTEYEFWPALLGPGSAVKTATVVHFSVLTFAIIAFLRTLSQRRPAFQVLEMVVIVGALSLLFQGHRHGEITRPLWLADWAWRNGYDPANILFFIGGGAALVLAGMMLLESPKEVRISFSSWAAFPVVALLFLGVWQVSSCENVQKPPSASNGLGLTHESKGDPPKNVPPNKEDPQKGKGGGG